MQLLYTKVSLVYLSVGDHADTDEDEDEETAACLILSRHTPAAHTHTRADGEL